MVDPKIKVEQATGSERGGLPPRSNGSILVVGASGLVGRALVEEFGAHARGTFFSRAKDDLQFLDITDRSAVRQLLQELAPAWILLPAAIPHVDWCEEHPTESFRVNVEGPMCVAEEAARAGARVAFFSSDYVFDGDAGPYDEQAPRRPINWYGRHKELAELRVLETDARNLVVRLCGVYGYEEPAKNFVMSLRRRLGAGERVTVPADQWGTPTYVRDIARATRVLLEVEASGVWHVAGPDYLPRHEFAFRACDALGLDRRLVQPVPTSALAQRARRPLRGGLSCRRLRDVGVQLRGVDAGLEALVRECDAAARAHSGPREDHRGSAGRA